jgi:hypothetical protein
MFIYYAKQSGKLVTLGENSRGMVGLENAMAAQPPCYLYWFGTTTRYGRFV